MASKPRIAITLAVLSLAGVVVACGGGDDAADDKPAGAAQSGSGDTGAALTMWTRAATEAASGRLVKEYNATHKNQVKLTVIPTDNYQARVAAAAGGNNLPDLFASDVIYAPNYTSQGLYLDITDRINELPFKDSLAPAHMRLGTFEDKQYTVPHTLDLSVLFWNKKLYEEAGLDPETPPKTMKEFAEQATTIREKIGGDTYGTFFGGNCPGCYVFTFWPSVWAAGGDIMNEDGYREHDRRPEHGGDVQDLQPARQGRRRGAGRQGRSGADLDRRVPEGQDRRHADAVDHARRDAPGHGHRRRADPGPGRRRVDVRGRRRDRHLGELRAGRRGLGLPRLDARRRGAGRVAGQEQGRRRPHRPRRQQVLVRGPARRALQRDGRQGRDAVLAELRRDLQRPDRPVAEGGARRGVRL